MGKALRIISMVVIFVIFFEVGLISSYTIVTSDIPDVKGLIDMQVDKVKNIFSPSNVNQVFIKDPTNISISNKEDVSLALQTITEVDGIDMNSLNVTTYDDKDNKELNVTIECLGFAEPSTNSSQIVISNTPAYKIIATGKVKLVEGHYKLDKDSLQVQSILKLYNSA